MCHYYCHLYYSLLFRVRLIFFQTFHISSFIIINDYFIISEINKSLAVIFISSYYVNKMLRRVELVFYILPLLNWDTLSHFIYFSLFNKIFNQGISIFIFYDKPPYFFSCINDRIIIVS